MTNKKTQILMIHGGMTFKNEADYVDWLENREISLDSKERWSDKYLDEKLGDDFEIIRLSMPGADDAKYKYWKIHFERHFEFLGEDIILIGKSLGGIFLAHYLSENKFPVKIKKCFLVAPPFDNSLTGEDLVGGFELPNDLSLFEENCPELYLMFSRDDDVVPIAHVDKYKQKLKNASFVIFDSKNGHFQISEFPEIIEKIKD